MTEMLKKKKKKQAYSIPTNPEWDFQELLSSPLYVYILSNIVVQSLSHVQHFATPCLASLSFTIS